MFGQFLKCLLLKVEGCHFNEGHFAFCSPIHSTLNSQFNFPQVHFWQCLSAHSRPFSDSLPSITYSLDAWALTGWLSPSCLTSWPTSMSHRGKTLSPIILVSSHSCLLLHFWPQASLIWSPLSSRLCVSATESAPSPGCNSLSPLHWCFPSSFHSKVIPSFLNIPAAISFCHSDATCSFCVA